MSIGKIALGVFLGNLAFGVLAWVAIAAFTSREQARADRASAQAQYRVLEGNAGAPTTSVQ